MTIYDQIQGKILAYLPWEGYTTLEEVSLHTRIPPLIVKENIYRLRIRKMIIPHPKNNNLVKKCAITTPPTTIKD